VNKSTLESSYTFVLFDGVCALCNGFVKFIFKFDKNNKIKVAPIQSTEGQKILMSYNSELSDLSTVVVVKNGLISSKFKAVICVLTTLGGVWKVIAMLMQLVPTVIGDFFYDIVAKTRYKIFGKYEQCPIPTKDEIKKFINEKDLP
jgi:predicted DCC family thiol-disulfide oxidoreductase YuxK